MKNKRILITYLENGNMQTQVAKERMFSHVRDELLDKGLEVYEVNLQPNSKIISFTDGTRLMLFPVAQSTAVKATHMYIEGSIKDFENGDKLAQKLIKSCLMTEDYENYDTSGKQVNYFTCDNSGEINID